MRHDDLLRQRQSKARAALLRRIEQIKHVLALFFADAGALIVNLNADAVVISRRFHFRYSASRHRFARVAQQIQKRLTELGLVHGYFRQVRGQVEPKLDTGSVHLPPHELGEILDEMGRILRVQ
jgi:hypothetical protein